MDAKQKLELEITQQETAVRSAGRKHMIDAMSRPAAIVTILLGVSNNEISVVFFLGIIFLIFTIYNTKQSHEQLQSEEQKLIELKNRLITQF